VKRIAGISFVILCAVACLGARDAAAAPAAKSLGVVYSDGRSTEDVPLERIERESEELFVSAFDLARIFKATKFWNPGNRKLVLRIGARRYLFTIDTRVVMVDETPVMLRVPVRYADGAVMVPLEFITDILAPRAAEKIALDRTRLLLSIGVPEYNVTGIGISDDRAGTRASLELAEELLYHIDSETPGLLRLKIYGGRLDPVQFSIPEGKGLLNRVRAEQMEHDAYLFFDVKTSVKRYKVEFETAGADGRGSGARRLVLFLERGALPEIPPADFAGKKMVEMLAEGARRAIVEPMRTIAVDPGHGGTNTGRVSRSGVMEKDVNLAIALGLRDRLMQELGVDVVMTRTEDVDVSFEDRVEAANTARAQLFISIHCNGWYTPDAQGFEVFFLAPARTADEERLAREENTAGRIAAGAPDESAADIDFILWDMAQNEYINESSDLAEMIQREMAKTLSIRNRGVKQAGLYVLRGLAMPGVLVETAFLSNPKEERLLQSVEFRDRVVEAIVGAVRAFQSRYAAPARR
jgi:N-acetylmuramoyl-L-alanine amidase